MGKQFSRLGGLRTNTRRQRSQLLAQHQDRLHRPNGSPSVNSTPRILEADRTILTLKLQRDELTMYKGRLAQIQRREEKILRRLVLNGKREAAKVLLKKRRFQKYILEESEREVISILHQTDDHSKFFQIKQMADHCIERNSDTMKRIQMLLSLEHVEDILLEETPNGRQKLVEMDRLLLLATIGERRIFDKGLDAELDDILKTIQISGGQSASQVASPSASQELEAVPEETTDPEALVTEAFRRMQAEDEQAQAPTTTAAAEEKVEGDAVVEANKTEEHEEPAIMEQSDDKSSVADDESSVNSAVAGTNSETASVLTVQQPEERPSETEWKQEEALIQL